MSNTLNSKSKSLFSILKEYKALVGVSLFFSIGVNVLNLTLPQLIRRGIDTFSAGTLVLETLVFQFGAAAIAILVLMYVEALLQSYVAERVARDLRRSLSSKIADEPYSFIETETPAKLLTNLTSDVDAIKTFVSQASVQIIVSVFTLIGASTLLILINWKLALAVLTVIPIIAVVFAIAFSKMGPMFGKSQGIIDKLNTVISGSILGAALIRVVNSGKTEIDKFSVANTEARDTGMQILKLFSVMIPIVSFASSLASIIILTLGGQFVIAGSMSLGDFAAFLSYVIILIFPIFIIGFMSSVIGRSQASFKRIQSVLYAETKKDTGTVVKDIVGAIDVKNLTIVGGAGGTASTDTDGGAGNSGANSLSSSNKIILNDVSFSIKPKTRTAIMGPTAAGKTQLMYALVGLVTPKSGEIRFDDVLLGEYEKASLYSQVGFVFQDSVLFNLSLKENIAFSSDVTDESLRVAIETAELGDFVKSLPQGLDTLVSERGTTLSGGQKQRVMLARALAISPKILLLDDFTARVDGQTEKKIIENIARNYPDITLVSVTQKINSVESYDQIILLMEGELLASGTHQELMEKSPEYVQIFESQKSTTSYESQ
ncbi:MAG: ABC transporter ATP-binding protein [Candidatus Pacebacteria bacterium]|nr:ABC transporter ATP-binding protein [Candidatus Paceibacterota bacterium]MBP9818643.1 ABC transporter ATP-binding protein [Candidatus Paceibacterota bacterium]